MNGIHPVPIVILSYGCRHIEKSICSLMQSTRVPISIYVVNNSGKSSDHAHLINSLKDTYNLKIIHAPNLWVLSLNHPYVQSVFNNSSAYIVSDDILYLVYPQVIGLLEFMQLIHQHSYIGFSFVEVEPNPRSTSFRYSFPMAPSQLIHRESLMSGIYDFTGDTTPALYRSRLFSLTQISLLHK